MSKNSENQRLHASLHLASYSAYRGSLSHEFHHELLNDGTVTLIGPKLRMLLSGDGDADEVGMEKLMWGSDYPRTITAITYRMSYDFIVKSNRLTEREKALFLGENAQRFYGIKHILDLPYIKNMSE